MLIKVFFLLIALMMGRMICSTIRQAYHAKHDEGLVIDTCSLIFFSIITIVYLIAMGHRVL